jgi:hypothetical protein
MGTVVSWEPRLWQVNIRSQWNKRKWKSNAEYTLDMGPLTQMIKVIQANCSLSEDINRVIRSTTIQAGVNDVLIQEWSIKPEEITSIETMRNGNHIHIYSSNNHRPYLLTVVKKDLVWIDYRGI